jgi:streptogramin lyase
MRWFTTLLQTVRSPSRKAPKRDRVFAVEGLDGRLLLSHTAKSFVTVLAQSNMIAGPGGDLWVGLFSSSGQGSVIERIGPNLSKTSFLVPNSPSIQSITTGPDGDIWFDGATGNATGDTTAFVGKMTPTGQVTEYPPIPLPAGQSGNVTGIVSGTDGDLWFGDSVVDPSNQQFQSDIVQVTTTGSLRVIPVPGSNMNVSSIAAGSDGNLWFVYSDPLDPANSIPNGIGRMTPSGAVTEFPTGKLDPSTVATGPDGGLIMTGATSRGNNGVVQISTSGAATTYRIPAAISGAFTNYLGAIDGSLWFAGI